MVETGVDDGKRCRLRAPSTPDFDLIRSSVCSSPAHQFAALADAVEKESPTKAASMREWSPDAQVAMLKWLGDVTQEHPNPVNQVELWRVRKGERELRCLAVYLPTGIDVRLFEGDDFRRTQLVRDSCEVDALADKWRTALAERGWNQHVEQIP
jgi:hypothetical protein